MKVTLTLVPPGGGEADGYYDVDLPEIPRIGDYLIVFLEGVDGQSDFLVRRVKWYVKSTEKGGNATWDGVTVECEFALSERSSELHKKRVHANPGDEPPKDLEVSGF